MLLASILQDRGGGAAGAIAGVIGGLCGLAIALVLIIAMWRIFTKAGKPGWASIIPIYNIWVLLEIIGRPGWWLLLYFVPFVNLIIIIIVVIDLAKSFGKDIGYAIGMLILPIIFIPLLAFGDAQYQGPAAASV